MQRNQGIVTRYKKKNKKMYETPGLYSRYSSISCTSWTASPDRFFDLVADNDDSSTAYHDEI